MKWIYYKNFYLCTKKDILITEKFGIKVCIFPEKKEDFYLEKKQTPVFTVYCKENGKEMELTGEVLDRDLNIVNHLSFFDKLLSVKYPAYISEEDAKKEGLTEATLYKQLNSNYFYEIEKSLNEFILSMYNYLNECLNKINKKQISTKKNSFKIYVYSIIHLAKYIGFKYSYKEVKSLKKLKEIIINLIKNIENELFTKNSPFCIQKQTVVYDFSDIETFNKNTINLNEYQVEISIEDFLSRTLYKLINSMLIAQEKSEKEHFEKGKNLLYQLAKGDIAPNEFF